MDLQFMRCGNERERKIVIICYRKKQMDVSYSCLCPVIDNEFLYNIVKVVIIIFIIIFFFYYYLYKEYANSLPRK